MIYEITKEHPIPDDSGVHGRTKYPFAIMEVGDSFFVPREKAGVNTVDSARRKASRHLRRKFTLRTLPEGIRIWRIE